MNGQGKLTIRRDHNIRDGAIVASERLAGVTVRVLIRGKFPHHDGLVTRTGDETLFVSMGSGD